MPYVKYELEIRDLDPHYLPDEDAVSDLKVWPFEFNDSVMMHVDNGMDEEIVLNPRGSIVRGDTDMDHAKFLGLIPRDIVVPPGETRNIRIRGSEDWRCVDLQLQAVGLPTTGTVVVNYRGRTSVGGLAYE